MTGRKYRPHKLRKPWLDGAPDYVLACFDTGPETCDRYTIVFNWIEGGGTFGTTWLHYLGCSEGGRAVSQFGDFTALEFQQFRRANARKRIAWLDIPADTRAHIIARATSE